MPPQLHSLRLQQKLLHWQWPRWRVRFHLRLWLHLGLLLLQLSPLKLWLQHPQLLLGLLRAWLRRWPVLQWLPERSMRRQHCPKRSSLLSLQRLPLLQQWRQWRQL
jgi:hypothetical protein